MLILLLALALQGTDRAVQPQSVHRGIAIDERLAADAKLRVGAMAVLTGEPNASSGDTVRIAAIVRRRPERDNPAPPVRVSHARVGRHVQAVATRPQLQAHEYRLAGRPPARCESRARRRRCRAL